MVGDFKTCVNVADSFFRIAQNSGESSDEIGELLSGMMYPIVVNTAFCCESYMKAIMIFDSSTNDSKTGHDLEELFRFLSITRQQEIVQKYNSKCSIDLATFLSESKDAFISWRYAFQYKDVGINITALKAFSETLKEYVHSIK